MNYQESILSAIIPRNQQDRESSVECLKEVIKNRVTAKYFTGYYKTLFEIVALQAQRPSALDMDLLTAYLSDTDYKDEQKTEIKILFSTCQNQFTPIDKIAPLCKAFVDEQNYISLSQALITSGEILSTGKKIGKTEFKGFDDAKKYLIDTIASVQSSDEKSYPSMALSESMEVFWENYFRKESNPHSGLMCGMKEIDELLNGFDPGEFVIFAAAYGEGKSTFLRDFAYFASVNQKKNVVYYTLEMPHNQIVREFISLHSLDPKFNCPRGLINVQVQAASLEPKEKIILKEVTDDLQNNPEYGVLKIIHLPSGSTVSSVRESLMYLQNEFPVNGVFIDYDVLLAPEISKYSSISESADTLKKLRDLATTFNGGPGVPIITAHQISREGKEKAENSEDQRYDSRFLSDTSEAEKSATQIFWLLRTKALERARELKMGIAKNRRGPKRADWIVREYFECGQITSIQQPLSRPGSKDIYE